MFDPTDPAPPDPDGDSAPSTSASANLDPWDSDDLAAVPSGDSFDGEPDEISDGIALIYRCSGCGDRWDLVWSPDLAAGPLGAYLSGCRPGLPMRSAQRGRFADRHPAPGGCPTHANKRAF